MMNKAPSNQRLLLTFEPIAASSSFFSSTSAAAFESGNTPPNKKYKKVITKIVAGIKNDQPYHKPAAAKPLTINGSKN